MPPGEPLSPELVLVLPPDEARRARAWLEIEHPIEDERAEQVRRAWERLAERQVDQVDQAWEIVAIRAAEQVERARDRIAVHAAERAQEVAVEDVAEPALEPEPELEPEAEFEPEPEAEPEPFVSDAEEDAPDWETLLERLRSEPLELSVTPDEILVEPEPQATTRRGSRRGIIAVVAALAVVVLVGVAWARDWIGGGKSTSPRASAPIAVAPRPTSASTPTQAKPKARAKKPTAPANPSPKKKTTKTTPARSNTKKKATPAFVPARVWSWPRVAGASRYRVRFFHNGQKVLDLRTTTPRLVLPRPFTFQKGRYRWTVLPISAGGKTLPAVVNSTFVVSG